MNRERLLALTVLSTCCAFAGWSYWNDGVVAIFFDSNVSSEGKIEALRMFFSGWGPFAPLAYILLVVVEGVIAPIPGAMLYLPGGVIFGGFWGGTLSLIGNVVAAGVCAVLMRTIVGRRWSRDFFTSGRISSVKKFILRHGLLSITVLRINPLTSSDIVSYAAGLTPLPVSTIMLGTMFGMAPLCYVQSYLSMSLFIVFPWLIWPLVVSCVIYAILAAMAIWRLRLPQMEEVG